MKAVGKGGCSRKEARVAEGSGQIERRGEERKREDRSQCRSVLRCPHTGSVHFKHVVHRCPLSSPHPCSHTQLMWVPKCLGVRVADNFSTTSTLAIRPER
uniref:Uncharacterized protein n=1 Tax=Trypanosoma congolense (strain IL3000) TaxID=1068625 RepID=G0UUF5_TRYCI|nr:hypothetical protein, unlikely [Trypanosoma congolense IL3000]